MGVSYEVINIVILDLSWTPFHVFCIFCVGLGAIFTVESAVQVHNAQMSHRTLLGDLAQNLLTLGNLEGSQQARVLIGEYRRALETSDVQFTLMHIPLNPAVHKAMLAY